ncbi:TrkH family potassium uptake protein [Nonomuraea salmonea]|uniref:TrkH family potassium uptake protein n=1 Tax=Nonomuraea salmonea TaxID=46181 RepID=UPI002FE7843A
MNRVLAWLTSRFQQPAQVVVLGFGLAITAGTALLALPAATTSGEPAGLVDALFTATSAVCVTGLAVVDTASHWSVFGELVIAGLVQVGGLGIMTMATVFTLLVSGRLGLRAKIVAQAETKALSASDIRHVIRKVVLFTLLCESVAAVVLTGRFMIAYGEPFGRALYLGGFHAVASFNNAGFALWPDSLMRFVTDPWICLTVAFACIVGGLGFPVVFELARTWRHPHKWSVLTRITLGVTVTLLVLGTLVFLMTEWRNPGTLGALDEPDKLLAAFFTAVMPRSAGFNTLDVSAMYPSSWLLTDLLMFIGGGQRRHRGRHQGDHGGPAGVRGVGRAARREPGQRRSPAAARHQPAAGRHGDGAGG